MAKELSFYGSTCTQDCSGHDAGWKWRRQNPQSTVISHSPSFVSGTVIRDMQVRNGTNLIGTAARDKKTGRFEKIQRK